MTTEYAIRYYPPRDGRATTGSSNTSFINGFDFYGHSYLDTTGGVPFADQQIGNKLLSALGIQWPMGRIFGIGGSSVNDHWRYMIQNGSTALGIAPYGWTARFRPTGFLYGANDVGSSTNPLFELSKVLNRWKDGWRFIFSWHRASAIYSPFVTYPSYYESVGTSYSGPNHWITDTADNEGSVGSYAIGGTYTYTTTAGASFDILVSPHHPGTDIWLYFTGEIGPNNGCTVATVSNPGGSMTTFTFSTNNRVRTQSMTTAIVNQTRSIVPIKVTLPAGDHTANQTIRVTATTLAASGRLAFLGWSVEAVNPPLLLPANIPVPGNWAGYNTNGIPGNVNGTVVDAQGIPAHWQSYPQTNAAGQNTSGGAAFGTRYNNGTGVQDADNWCRDSYNPALAAVAAEFLPAGTVSVVDLAAVMDGSTTTGRVYYSPNDLGATDELHPNNYGKAIIVREFLKAANRTTLDPIHLVAPLDANELVEGAAMLGNDQ